jgi:hypothetical protein
VLTSNPASAVFGGGHGGGARGGGTRLPVLGKLSEKGLLFGRNGADSSGGPDEDHGCECDEADAHHPEAVGQECVPQFIDQAGLGLDGRFREGGGVVTSIRLGGLGSVAEVRGKLWEGRGGHAHAGPPAGGPGLQAADQRLDICGLHGLFVGESTLGTGEEGLGLDAARARLSFGEARERAGSGPVGHGVVSIDTTSRGAAAGIAVGGKGLLESGLDAKHLVEHGEGNLPLGRCGDRRGEECKQRKGRHQ